MDSSAVVTVATQWRALLIQKQRADGSLYWCRSDDARDDALQDAIYKAHDGELPNDYTYQFLVNALDDLIAHDGDVDATRDDLTADDYNSDLLAWLASHSGRVSFCDSYLYDYRNADSIMDIIRGGQLRERVEVFESVTHHVRDAADALTVEAGK